MYHNFIFLPLYNGLVGIMDLLPWIDIGLAVVLFTFIVKLALFHLSKASILTQIKMKEVEPEANRIKAQYSSDKQAQALKVMELYKVRGIKPFSGILLLLIQLPILLALLSVFYKIIPTVNPEFLYSFVSLPVVKTQFLGLIDLTKPSLILALLTAVAQYIQLKYSFASKQMSVSTGNTSGGLNPADFAATMSKQMKYMLPVLAFVSTYWLIPLQFPQAASIIALYWSMSAIFTLGQELIIYKKYLKK
jgi:YidC/Oxa1 family membrane protein insertase